jgi:hypothetical protein
MIRGHRNFTKWRPTNNSFPSLSNNFKEDIRNIDLENFSENALSISPMH